MSVENAGTRLSDILDKAPATSHAGWIERRSETRPRFHHSWRKTVLLDGGRRRGQARVGVWIASTQSLLTAGSALRILTDDDWKAIRTMRAPEARNAAAATKMLVRLALSQTVERRIAPSEWRFAKTPQGKPLVSVPAAEVDFSVSHTDEVVMVAASSGLAIGVDVESIDQELATGVIGDFSHTTERTAFDRIPAARRTREFIQLWTKKEAYTKMLGCGHSLDFSAIRLLDGAAQADSRDGCYRQVRFESFYVPQRHCLYHATLAFGESEAVAESIDIQLVHVSGPASADGTFASPMVR